MFLKDYQREAIQSLDKWLDNLNVARSNSEKIIAQLETIDVKPTAEHTNYPQHAWKRLREEGRLTLQTGAKYIDRYTDADNPIPHICLKVPTGGGKTLLGAAAVERILMHSGKNTGLLLWIVPTRAIYEQTKTTLWDRQHPYRQRLELASGGRVKVLEKDDAFTADDIRSYLCTMLLMLPAANRHKGKDFLRMFRNSGRYPGFFPEDGNALAEGEFLYRHPHLEREGNEFGGIVKHSLINVFKICRPIVILDEAHKAYGKKVERSEQYARAINRMDPSIVVELSATPNHGISNVLVDIKGTALKDEQMIKLPIQVETRSDTQDWRHTLELAHQRLEDLSREAERLETENGRYIRPIAVARVERTGKKQRDGINIHAEDARDHLISIGVNPESIRVKSSEADELGREDLISDGVRSPVNWIITKDALKEGWDCPFAYVLVLLDNTRAKTAITQMVGRVLRMPHAQETGKSSLDRCYVICHNAEVRDTVSHVRAGLENEGMGDISGHVEAAGAADEIKKISVLRRQRFRGKRIFLPKVLHRDDAEGWRDLDYDRDIISAVQWQLLEVKNVQGLNVAPATGGTAVVDIEGETENVEDRYLEADDDIDLVYFARRIGSVVPNPWRAMHIAEQALSHLMELNDVDRKSVNASRALYAEQFRADIWEQIDIQARDIFVGKFDRKELRFDLQADEGNYELGDRYDEIVGQAERKLERHTEPVQRTLFEPMLEKDFNGMEQDFAFYLDRQNAILWWHRVAARQRGGYFLRGWRRDRIFPDFVAVATRGGSADVYQNQLLMLETKGTHLRDNPDTKYKQRVFGVLQEAYNGTLSPRGEMTLNEGNPKGVFRLVFQEEIETALADTILAQSA